MQNKGQGKPTESDKAGIAKSKNPPVKTLVASDIKVKETQDDTVSMFDQDDYLTQEKTEETQTADSQSGDILKDNANKLTDGIKNFNKELLKMKVMQQESDRAG